MVHSCSVTDSSAHTYFIKLVRQLPTRHSSQSAVPQAGGQSAGTDEGTAGRHFQLTEATWLGVN